MTQWTIRTAGLDDAAACAAIYAAYVADSAVTFETDPPSVADMAARIEASLRGHAWLVVTDDDQVVRGYAYGGQYSPREAYRTSCEVSVYLAPDVRGEGLGSRLYGALLPALRERGLYVAVGRITLPNDASVRLHEAFGFTEVGVFRDIGFKLGAWRDVLNVQLHLLPTDAPPAG